MTLTFTSVSQLMNHTEPAVFKVLRCPARIIGDSTKMVKSAPIAARMHEYMTDPNDTNWQIHFNKLVADSEFPDLNDIDPIVPKIQRACKDLADRADSFRRQSLQTRFFETGDNYYLGMEFTREYDRWKADLGRDLVSPLSLKPKSNDIQRELEN